MKITIQKRNYHFYCKKGFAQEEEFLIYLKDLRNRIAHEYIGLGVYTTKEFINEILENFYKIKDMLNFKGSAPLWKKI